MNALRMLAVFLACGLFVSSVSADPTNVTGLVLWLDAYAGVADFDAQRHFIVQGGFHGDTDLSLVGELDGIGEQVEQALPEQRAIAHVGGGQAAVDVAVQAQTFLQ